jgi:hypothetical protein
MNIAQNTILILFYTYTVLVFLLGDVMRLCWNIQHNNFILVPSFSVPLLEKTQISLLLQVVPVFIESLLTVARVTAVNHAQMKTNASDGPCRCRPTEFGSL